MGQMPLAAAFTISAHLESCSVCRDAVGGVERTEGQRLETSRPALMEPTSFADVMGVIDTPTLDAAGAKANPASIADVRLPVAAARAGLRPRRWLAPTQVTLSRPGRKACAP